MKNKLHIYVPSRGRVGKVSTLALIPPDLLSVTTLVVRHDEASAYAAEYPHVSLMVLPRGTSGLSPTRQRILEASGRCRWLAMLDDDITGFCVKKDSKTFGGLRRVKNDQVAFRAAMGTCVRWLERGLAHVGVSERYMAARPSERFYYENNRIGQFIVWDRKVLVRERVDFNRAVCMQDLDANLQLLTRGYPSRVLTKYSYVAKPEDYRGGCALYRNDAVKKRACDRIEALWPGIVQSLSKEKFGRTYFYAKTTWRAAKKLGGVS